MAFSDIEHIVVLVMENRSFDHMLGYLSLSGGRTDVDGLRPGMSNPNPRTGEPAGPVLLSETRFDPGPAHDHFNVMKQLGNPTGGEARMDGFVADYAGVKGVKVPSAVMGYYDQQSLWFYDFLAREYAICDRWFSAFPGPTQINRAFLLAGHSANKVSNGELLAYTTTHRLLTLFDVLSHAGVTWQSYFHDVPELRSFIQFTFQLGHIHKIDRFYDAAAAGKLPAVSWIDPNFELQGGIGLPDGGNDDHPPADIRRGQELVSNIYRALTTKPAAWQKTLFIITYDEHGGFYDHVSPPVLLDRAPFRKNTLFDRFGVRVPAFIVSPWVARGSVSHSVFEHTSIAKTILQRFCPEADRSLMGQRLDGAPSLQDLLLTSARHELPTAPNGPTIGAGPLRAVGGRSLAATDLTGMEPSDLQLHLRAMRLRLLGEGLPPDTV